MIENDSNPEVRRAVLSCIAPSAKTLPKIVERTKDIKDIVRKLAYQVSSVSYVVMFLKDEPIFGIWKKLGNNDFFFQLGLLKNIGNLRVVFL